MAKLNRHVPTWIAVLVLAVALVGGAWYGWRRATHVPVPFQRSAADFVVRWTCDQGHSFEDHGAAGAKTCPQCGADCYATFSCACQDASCGNVATMQLRYDDKLKIDAMRWRPAGDWQPYVFPPPCPKCGTVMRPG